MFFEAKMSVQIKGVFVAFKFLHFFRHHDWELYTLMVFTDQLVQAAGEKAERLLPTATGRL